MEAQTKCVATALRAEKRLKEHMAFLGHRGEMMKQIESAQRFEQGQSADMPGMLVEERKEQKAKSQKITAVSDNLKFGRGKKNVANHF